MRGILALLVFCGYAANAEKTLVYCSEASPSTFNPQLADDGPTFNASSSMLFNRLVEFEDGGTKIVPALAEKWDISKDGKTYTFYLRKNATFHSTDAFKPTRPMNAEDVLFSFNRALKKDHPFHNVSGGKYVFFTNMELTEMIKSIEKVNDSTVKFVLNQPNAPFIANMAMSFAVIHSKEYADQLLKAGTPEKLDIEPVGTAPLCSNATSKTIPFGMRRIRPIGLEEQSSIKLCFQSRRMQMFVSKSSRQENAT